MPQETAPSAPPAGSQTAEKPAASAPAPWPTETVTRPDPGLARGVWEAPPWALWAGLGVVLVAAALYVARRAGLLRFGRGAAASDEAPRSRRPR